MKYAHQFLVTRVSLIAIGAMLTVPLPAVAGEIHGKQGDASNVSLGGAALYSLTTGERNTAIGAHALRKNTTGKHNTASGYKALNKNTKGNYNTASGASALHMNTTGDHNTANGSFALMNNTTGDSNTAIGVNALTQNTTGHFNTASGDHALTDNTTGKHNTASGAYALYKNTKGDYNTATGYFALQSNSTGNKNTAIGSEALRKNTGNHNTANGFHALWKNTSGVKNTGLGAAALRDNLTGKKNTSLGFRAGAKNTSGWGNVFIGHEAAYSNTYKTKSNKLVIANGSAPTNELITGDFFAHTVDIRGNLHATGNVTTSDGRLKKDIQPLAHALDAILQLEGKTYRWKEDTTFANKQDIGLVAQDVERIFPELVAENERGYKGIAYSKLTAVLIEAIKEQQNQITTLQQENQQLKSAMVEQMDALLARVAMLEGASLMAAN